MSVDEISAPSGMDRVFLLPGEFHVARKPKFIATLLGSCVSVCLKNRKNGSAAMNHFVRDRASDLQERDIGRFGDLSTRYIIDSLFSVDPVARNYEAKIFGGGNVVSSISTGVKIGQTNIDVAREILAEYNIPIIKSEVGGRRGKKIYFNTTDFTVTVRDIGEDKQDFSSRDIKVLVVDDSKLVRSIFIKVINSTPGFTVCGEAQDAFEARNLIVSLKPDVVSLDIIMPRLDGLSFLEKIMQYAPLPVVVVSTIAKDKSVIEKKAQRIGAVGVIDKDSLEIYKGLDVLNRDYISMLRVAANANVKRGL